MREEVRDGLLSLMIIIVVIILFWNTISTTISLIVTRTNSTLVNVTAQIPDGSSGPFTPIGNQAKTVTNITVTMLSNGYFLAALATLTLILIALELKTGKE